MYVSKPAWGYPKARVEVGKTGARTSVLRPPWASEAVPGTKNYSVTSGLAIPQSALQTLPILYCYCRQLNGHMSL